MKTSRTTKIILTMLIISLILPGIASSQKTDGNDDVNLPNPEQEFNLIEQIPKSIVPEQENRPTPAPGGETEPLKVPFALSGAPFELPIEPTPADDIELVEQEPAPAEPPALMKHNPAEEEPAAEQQALTTQEPPSSDEPIVIEETIFLEEDEQSEEPLPAGEPAVIDEPFIRPEAEQTEEPLPTEEPVITDEPFITPEPPIAPEIIPADEETAEIGVPLFEILDEQFPDRRIVIYAYWGENDYVKLNDTVRLTAQLSGYEGLDYAIRWQFSANGQGGWQNIGEAGTTYSFKVNEENYYWFWRVAVDITGVSE